MSGRDSKHELGQTVTKKIIESLKQLLLSFTCLVVVEILSHI